MSIDRAIRVIISAVSIPKNQTCNCCCCCWRWYFDSLLFTAILHWLDMFSLLFPVGFFVYCWYRSVFLFLNNLVPFLFRIPFHQCIQHSMCSVLCLISHFAIIVGHASVSFVSVVRLVDDPTRPNSLNIRKEKKSLETKSLRRNCT